MIITGWSQGKFADQKETCGSNQTTCHWGFYFFRKLKGAIFFKKENYQSEKYKQKILAWKPSEAEQIVNTEIKAGL